VAWGTAVLLLAYLSHVRVEDVEVHAERRPIKLLQEKCFGQHVGARTLLGWPLGLDERHPGARQSYFGGLVFGHLLLGRDKGRWVLRVSKRVVSTCSARSQPQHKMKREQTNIALRCTHKPFGM